jgi:hypothetical protein
MQSKLEKFKHLYNNWREKEKQQMEKQNTDLKEKVKRLEKLARILEDENTHLQNKSELQEEIKTKAKVKESDNEKKDGKNR